MHIVLVQVQVKPDCVEAFKAATEINARASLLEPGLARFDCLQQSDEPCRFLLLEAYRSAEAAVAHKQTSHYEVWRDRVAPMMAVPRVGIRYVNTYPEDSTW